jgi:hypothetical protein
MSKPPVNQLLDTSACLEAIATAVRVLGPQVPNDEPFTLVSVVNLAKGAAPPAGPTVWELTFKPARLLPEDPLAEVGAGGEWIVRIDLARADNPVRVIRGE